MPRAMRDKGVSSDAPARGTAKSRPDKRMAAAERQRSPIQALKASVKKAATKKGGKSARKSRR